MVILEKNSPLLMWVCGRLHRTSSTKLSPKIRFVSVSFSKIDDVYSYLEQRPMFGKVGAKAANFALENMQAFMAFLGNPQQKISCIHVAGTNGKGSVSAMLYAIYSSAGYKSALFTSPHLIDYTERFLCDGQRPSEDDLLQFFQEASEFPQFESITYFELSTALAFWWFWKMQAEICVIEVGLGGRLDATNLIEQPLASVITSIGFDHTDILGDTLSKIAFEKAGIIKNGCPTIIGKMHEEAEASILDVAIRQNSDVILAKQLGLKWLDGRLMEIEFLNEKMEIFPSLLSRSQIKNVDVVLSSVQKLNTQFPVSPKNVRIGIEKTSELAHFFGRFEKLDSDKSWYFDGGHNEQALEETVKTAKSLFGNDVIWVFSMMNDKIASYLPTLFSDFTEIFYYSLPLDRAARFESFKSIIHSAKPLPKERVSAVLSRLHTNNIVFTGSFYFYNTVKGWIAEQRQL